MLVKCENLYLFPVLPRKVNKLQGILFNRINRKVITENLDCKSLNWLKLQICE